jgi:hypothetical protein
VTPTVADERCDVGKKKDDKVFAANPVARMLLYLKPTEFPCSKGEENGGVMAVPEMMKKIGHIGVNNLLLMKLGWIEAIRGSRKNHATAI